MSLETKISESVFHGSIFLALEQNFFMVKELLTWLVDQPCCLKTKIAYKAVCYYLSLNDQYLADGYHFLYRCANYVDIAVCFSLNVYIPDRNDDLTLSAPLYFHLYPIDNTITDMSKFIIDGQATQDYLLDNLTLCYLARNDPYFKNHNISPDEYNEYFLNSDWLNKLRYTDKLAELLLTRVRLIESLAVNYSKLVIKEYHLVAQKIHRLNLIKLTREQVEEFNNYFPNILSSHIFNYQDLAFKISLLNNDLAGYLLGFAIDKMIPNNKQIKEALDQLDKLGVEEYCQRLKQKYEVILANETDVLMEPIDDYSPFDIVSFQTGDHLYRFSRAEFDNILQTKKNPWTNEDLHPTILSSMYARNLAACEIKLPECKILKDLLNGGVFESSVEIVKVNNSNLENRYYDLDILIFEVGSESEDSITEEEIEEEEDF